jgi:inosine-uridine nucleoside N-ribohydrolase
MPLAPGLASSAPLASGAVADQQSNQRKIIIDTDPGIDDAMAIFYALESPELDVVGLTTVFGNAHVETCTTNALTLLEIAGRAGIPVAQGAGKPLVSEYRGPVPIVHGADGQGDVFLPPPSAKPAAVDAARFIIDTVMAAPGEITLVPLGPLTNIALALMLEPALGEHIAEIVLMGGAAFRSGNTTPAAEANIFNDPDAADIVFGAGCSIVMAGLDVTEATVMTSADIARIGTFDNPRARHLSAILPHYVAFSRMVGSPDGIPVHDSSAISYLVCPDAYRWVDHPVRVDCGHSFGRGATIPAVRASLHENAWSGRGPTRILTEVDARAVVELELERMQQASLTP